MKKTSSASDVVVAIGYARVSTNDQEDSGLGLAAQRAAIKAECERRGWTLLRIATDVASGKTTKGRDALKSALSELEDGSCSVLVAAKLDRIARSVVDFAGLMERAQRRGWGLVALDAQVDTTTPQGALMTHVLAAFAEYERRLIGQRTKDALAAKRASGTRLGRPVALPQSVRMRIQREVEQGRSLREIAADLEVERIPTARGGDRWYASTIRSVVASLQLDASSG